MRIAYLTLLVAAALAIGSAATAQDDAGVGTISGVVLDGSSGDPIIEAGVEVISLKKTVRTDLDGRYTVKVPPGAYELRMFAPGFRGARIERVVVQANKVAIGDATLAPAGQAGIDVVEVVAQADKAAEATQLLKRQKAAVVSDNVSAEAIRKSPDADAAEIVQRVPAVTIKDDKFIVVRGLNERYSSALLNGSRLPSTDPDRRVVPLDLFPADFLESIAIIKTYTPDLPGDFSGGLADVRLREFPEKLSYSIGIATGANTEATFQKFQTYKGGGFDYFGFDQNVRSLPRLIPSSNVVGAPGAQAQAYGRSFKDIWDPDSITAPPNFGINFSIGNTIGPLGLELAGIYTTEYKSRTQLERQFLNAGSTDDPSIVVGNDFTFDVSTFETRLGAVFTAAYDLAPNHRITFRSLLDRNSMDEVLDGRGTSEQTTSDQETTVLTYTQEELAFGQLAGEHRFPGIELDWRSAFSRTTQEKPDTRFVVRNDGVFGNESNGGVRAFSDLTEYLSDSAVDLTVPFTTAQPFSDAWRLPAKFKFGPAYAYRSRDSDLRRFRFRRVGGDFDLTLPADVLLAPENIGPQGFAFLEETLPQDAFQASEEIIAGYGMFDLPIVRNRLRFVGGVRMEYSYITLDTFDQSSGLPTTIIKNNLDPLPGGNLIYTPRADMNIRLGYSRSVSRPEFRELSPAVFPAPKGLRPVVGDPTLVQADIESYDVRWEWFYTPSELVSLSGFYKSLDKPIEQVVIDQGGSGADSFANADTATLEGFEFEGRKNFGFVSAALANVNMITNVAYVHSNVDVPSGGLAQVQTSTSRPLQGQAPFVVNTSLEYAHPTLGTARLLYNTAGRRITSAGAFGLPDIYEERRDQLDLVLISRIAPFGTPMNVKFAVENILNDNVEFTQGGRTQRDYDPGVKFSIGLSYTY